MNMLFDLNIDVNLSQNIQKERENPIMVDSPTNTEISGTSSSSSVVNADESPISGTGIYDFFVNNPKPDTPFVTRQLFPVLVEDNTGGEDGGGGEFLRLGSSQSSNNNNNKNNQWLNLSVSGSGLGSGPEVVVAGNEGNKQQVRRSRRGPRSRSSQYRGVTFYRRTGRWESHIWDCGKQVYLGGFDTAHAAARAYDRAAIKFRGVDADINFNIADYDEDMKQQIKNLSKEEFVQILRRQSNGFAQGNSRYRGAALQKCGRWNARMGQLPGNKAYDQAAIQCNGREAVTTFNPTTYEGQTPMQTKNEGDGHNLDLNLGISITINGPKASNNIGGGESQTLQPPIEYANGKRPMNGASIYYSPGGLPLYGQPMASAQSSTMWPGMAPGRPGTYEDKVNDLKVEAITSGRVSNWAWYMQSQGQGGGGREGGTSNQVQYSTAAAAAAAAASSGFPFPIDTASSTTSFSRPHCSNLTKSFQQYGQGRS